MAAGSSWVTVRTDPLSGHFAFGEPTGTGSPLLWSSSSPPVKEASRDRVPRSLGARCRFLSQATSRPRLRRRARLAHRPLNFQMSSQPDVPLDPAQRRPMLAQTFHPSAAAAVDATEVRLGLCESRDGVDIRMVRKPGFCLDATV